MVADGCGRLRTVANGCGRFGNVERTHPQPPDPQSETGTLATHSGKKHQLNHQLNPSICNQVTIPINQPSHPGGPGGPGGPGCFALEPPRARIARLDLGGHALTLARPAGASDGVL